MLLLQLLNALYEEDTEEKITLNVEKKNRILTRFYLLRDYINNNVLIKKLVAKKDNKKVCCGKLRLLKVMLGISYWKKFLKWMK